MNLVVDSFPATVFKKQIGTSVLGEPLVVYAVMRGVNELSAWEEELAIRNSMLIDGAIHARELTTMSQTVFSMLTLLYKLEIGDAQVIELLENSALLFMPVWNVDGYKSIDLYYNMWGEMEYFRKNRRFYSDLMSECASTVD